MKTKLTALSLAIVILASLFTLTACTENGSGTTSGATGREKVPAQEIGDGRVTFRFEVTDDTGTIKAWNVNTDQSIVGEALLEVGLISGEAGSLGLYVTEVNGLVADYMANESWWGFYIDGEMAMAGVDGTDIEMSKVYAFIYNIE
ncbi:MAG: DUF4430 domain-containing protein [Oscillospiraceae bacterium]|nr:DUF4430 domain-containing protein [Oscillospiraceae bacterium]